MIKSYRTVLAAGALVATINAGAATTNTTFQVSASVAATCSVSANALNFGAYTPGGGAIDASSTINVTCTNGAGFNVGLDAGLAPTATTVTRRMRSAAVPTNELAYALYTDSTRLSNWGVTVGTDTKASTGAGLANPVPITVYGRISDSVANQAATVAADYADTITVTVTY